MARAKAVARKVRRAPRGARRPAPARSRGRRADPLLAAIAGATRTEVGGVVLDVARAGAARVKRAVYPPGFRWSAGMKPLVATALCMHAHVGFLARGAIRIEYPDGCAVTYRAPQVVAIEPGHDGAVVGRGEAVLIEVDFEGETLERLGIPAAHRHA